MKTIGSYLLIALVALFSLTACGNDPKPGKASILGTWEITEATTITNGEQSPANYLIGETLIFNEDGTASWDEATTSYDLTDDQLILHWESNGEQWDETLTVVSLTDTELHLREIQTAEELGLTLQLDMILNRK